MNLATYVETLRRELAVAAEAGGDEARALAERLTGPLESAARLVLLEALSAAANEITRDLAPGSVDVRLRGRDPEFVVTSPPTSHDFDDVEPTVSQTASSGPDVAHDESDDGGTSRTTLRLSEKLKLRVEEAAARDGLSVNAWLVRAIAASVEPREQGRRTAPSGGQRYTGWAR
jgi:hypothetical protein